MGLDTFDLARWRPLSAEKFIETLADEFGEADEKGYTLKPLVQDTINGRWRIVFWLDRKDGTDPEPAYIIDYGLSGDVMKARCFFQVPTEVVINQDS